MFDRVPTRTTIQKRGFTLQRKDDNSTKLASATPAAAYRQTNNTGLPDNLKAGMEHYSGYSLDDVTVHYNSAKPAQLQAHAYAQGSDIYLGSGQEKHLPHEAWHVVQQKQGRVKPTLQMKGNITINDDAGLEKEADVMGAKALQMKFEHGSAQLMRSLAGSQASSAAQCKVVQRHLHNDARTNNAGVIQCANDEKPARIKNITGTARERLLRLHDNNLINTKTEKRYGDTDGDKLKNITITNVLLSTLKGLSDELFDELVNKNLSIEAYQAAEKNNIESGMGSGHRGAIDSMKTVDDHKSDWDKEAKEKTAKAKQNEQNQLSMPHLSHYSAIVDSGSTLFVSDKKYIGFKHLALTNGESVSGHLSPHYKTYELDHFTVEGSKNKYSGNYFIGRNGDRIVGRSAPPSESGAYSHSAASTEAFLNLCPQLRAELAKLLKPASTSS